MQEDTVSTTVVDAVAKDKGIEPTDLPPLHGAIDPDALEAVVATAGTGSRVFYVEFEFASRIVTVEPTEVSVRTA